MAATPRRIRHLVPISLQVDIAKTHLVPGNVYKWKTEEVDTRRSTEKYFNFLIPEKKDRKKILQDIKLVQSKSFSRDVKMQMMQDIFIKWKNVYADRAK